MCFFSSVRIWLVLGLIDTHVGIYYFFFFMSEDVVLQVGGLVMKEGVEPRITDGCILEGEDGWHPTSFIRLIQDYGLDIDVSG